ncbi:MAG: hypothetical protein CV089_20220 [Nitrospira sp. WS110]|nr:hypothetical protein [Nitrospira sp. WS110]
MTKKRVPGPATSDPKTDRRQYEADCLAGRRFPEPSDTRLQARCRDSWKLAEWIELYGRYHLANLSDGRHRAGTIRLYLTPLLGLNPHQVTRLAVSQWFRQLGATKPSRANDVLMDLRLCYCKMEDWGWFSGVNPAHGIKRFPHRKPRSRFVRPEELGPLLASLQQAPLPYQLLFLLCLLVGCRPGEANQMRWRDLKLWQERDPRTGQMGWKGRWTKPITKNDLPHVVPIPAELIPRFHDLPRTSEWVFAGHPTHPRRLAPGPLSYANIHKHWQQIARRAGLGDVHPHDLRRTCATYLVNRGVNIALVSKGVLNHVNLQTTGVYTQAMAEPVEVALNNNAERVLNQEETGVGAWSGTAAAPTPPVAPMPSPRVSLDPSMDWPG